MENELLDLKLKVLGHGLFDILTKIQIRRLEANEANEVSVRSGASERNETMIWDFIELIIQSDEILVEAARSSLVKMAKMKRIKETTHFLQKMS